MSGLGVAAMANTSPWDRRGSSQPDAGRICVQTSKDDDDWGAVAFPPNRWVPQASSS